MSKKWGTPTWYFFHSFAENISDDFYRKNKYEICNMLRSVCSNLPCYDCNKHSIQYTRNTLHGRFVPDKESLKNYFFTFHNSVNVRTGKSKFNNYDMYKQSKLSNIIHNFSRNFYSYRNPHRGFSDQLSRKHIINNIMTFMKQNSQHFVWIH